MPGNVTRANNNALLSLVSPQYDMTLAQHHRNLSLANVRIDTPVASVVRVAFLGNAAASSLVGLGFCNVTVRSPLHWLTLNRSVTPTPGGNFLVAQRPSSIGEVVVAGVSLAGELVRSDAAWGMVTDGVSVQYREAC